MGRFAFYQNLLMRRSKFRRPRLLKAVAPVTLMALVTCTHVETLTSTSSPILESLAAASGALPADGDTTTTVTAIAKPVPGPSSALTWVLFTSDLGAFVENGLDSVREPIDSKGEAIVSLRAPLTAGVAKVQATDGTAEFDTLITFVVAAPDTLLLISSATVLSDTSVTTITATLRRSRGIPTLGDTAYFSARDSLGNSIGLFGAPSPSDSMGRVNVQYSPGTVGFSGTVTITASTAGPTGRAVTGLVRLLVLAP